MYLLPRDLDFLPLDLGLDLLGLDAFRIFFILPFEKITSLPLLAFGFGTSQIFIGALLLDAEPPALGCASLTRGCPSTIDSSIESRNVLTTG